MHEAVSAVDGQMILVGGDPEQHDVAGTALVGDAPEPASQAGFDLCSVQTAQSVIAPDRCCRDCE
jgi:hypothetical protein